MMHWAGKRVVVIGGARQGLALAGYLAKQGANVIINDRQTGADLLEAQTAFRGMAVEWVLGAHPLALLDGADIVCPSGGIPLNLPLLVEAQRRGIPFSNDSQVFMEAVPCPVIGITGSAGKTTTTTLVGRMAGALTGRKTWVGGNIGNPLISVVDQMKPEDLAVVELSSFQLELMSISPQVGAVLNVTPNHLDRHGTMAAYKNAKANILKYQTQNDVAVLSCDDPGAWSLRTLSHGQLISFGRSQPSTSVFQSVFLRGSEIVLQNQNSDVVPLLRRDRVFLRGEHNLDNVLAACAIVVGAGLPVDVIPAGVDGFAGVPHRLEFVRTWGGADWYNDSIATAPERAMAGIRAFDCPLILLAGGRDKDLPWDEFAELVCERVVHLIAFGETAEMICQKIQAAAATRRPETVTSCAGLADAVQAAAKLTSPGDVVLLSPGGTSFDEFKDFAERGDQYKKWIFQLA